MEDQAERILEAYRRSYWDYFLALERRFAETEHYRAFSKHNEGAFSVEYLTLFLAICGEIDALGKEIAGRFFPDEDVSNCSINKWGYFLCEAFPSLGEESVEFAGQFKFRPFDGWRQVKGTNKNGRAFFKRADDSEPLGWWNAYNKVKHSRAVVDDSTGLSNYEKASQGNVLKAAGALFLMNRLMMKRIDEDSYSSVPRSELFMLCGSIDEARSSLFYDGQGRPCMRVTDPPEPLRR